MRNQLRAAFYLLARSAYLKVAVVGSVLYVAFMVWLALSVEGSHINTGGQSVVLLAAPLVSCYVAAGFVGADRKLGGVRTACSAQNGRAAYVTSRFVATLAATAIICLLHLALALLIWLITGMRVDYLDYASPMASVWTLSAVLITCAYAQLAQLFCWRIGSVGVTVFLSLCLANGSLGMALDRLLYFLGTKLPLVEPLCEVVRSVLLFPSQALVGTATAPADLVGLFVIPLGWLVATYALDRLFWAKREV